MTEGQGRLGNDICTMPPGCGWTKPIVHIGQKGKQTVKLCKECYEALSPQPKALDPIEWQQKQEAKTAPRAVANWEALKMFTEGMLFGGVIGAVFIWLAMGGITS